MPDVNVLVYAHRADAPEHLVHRTWLQDVTGRAEPFALSVLVAIGFIRVTTNPRLLPEPSPLSAALAFIEELAAGHNCRVVLPGQIHFGEVLRLCRATGVSGSSVADAQHAAMAIEHGCTWVTADRGFARFAPYGLRWQHLTA